MALSSVSLAAVEVAAAAAAFVEYEVPAVVGMEEVRSDKAMSNKNPTTMPVNHPPDA